MKKAKRQIKKKKKPKYDDIRIYYLSNILQDDNLVRRPVLAKYFPWTGSNPDGDNEEVVEYWKALGVRLRKNHAVLQSKRHNRYQVSMTNGVAKR